MKQVQWTEEAERLLAQWERDAFAANWELHGDEAEGRAAGEQTFREQITDARARAEELAREEPGNSVWVHPDHISDALGQVLMRDRTEMRRRILGNNE